MWQEMMLDVMLGAWIGKSVKDVSTGSARCIGTAGDPMDVDEDHEKEMNMVAAVMEATRPLLSFQRQGVRVP